MIKQNLKGLFSGILDFIFVPKCVSCGAALPDKDRVLCDECGKMYNLESKFLCKSCGYPHPRCVCRVNYKGKSFPLFHVTGYDINRDSVSKNMVLYIKDENHSATFRFMADELTRVLESREEGLFLSGKEPVLVTYIPRSVRAKRRAGHDQSKELARAVALRINAELGDVFSSISESSQKTLSISVWKTPNQAMG